MNVDDFLSDGMNKMAIEDGFTELDGIFQCNSCVGTYKRKGHLKTHLENKHGKTLFLSCKCGKSFIDMTKLSRHEKSCK